MHNTLSTYVVCKSLITPPPPESIICADLQCTHTKYEFKKGVKAWLYSKYEHSYCNPFIYFNVYFSTKLFSLVIIIYSSQIIEIRFTYRSITILFNNISTMYIFVIYNVEFN